MEGNPLPLKVPWVGYLLSCLKCSKVFATGKAVEDHMTEHGNNNDTQIEYENPMKQKICRYFRNGFCVKGDECAVKHSDVSEHQVPPCRRGQHCFFKAQNRCKFFHPLNEAQNTQQTQIKLCRFQERCWDMSSCLFSHNPHVSKGKLELKHK